MRGGPFMVATGSARGGDAGAADVARVAGAGLVDRPPAAAPAPRVDDCADGVPAEARAPHVGIFRGACRRRRPLPAAGQRAGTAGCARRTPYVADQHGLCTVGEPRRARFRLPDYGPAT